MNMKTFASTVVASVLLISATAANANYYNQDDMVQTSSSSRENVYEFTDSDLPMFSSSISDENEAAAHQERRPFADNLLNVVASHTRHQFDN